MVDVVPNPSCLESDVTAGAELQGKKTTTKRHGAAGAIVSFRLVCLVVFMSAFAVLVATRRRPVTRTYLMQLKHRKLPVDAYTTGSHPPVPILRKPRTLRTAEDYNTSRVDGLVLCSPVVVKVTCRQLE